MRFLIKILLVIFVFFTFSGCEEEPTGPGVFSGWEKTFGGSNSDYGYSVQQTTDGGYIIVGETESFSAVNSDIYLIKTDENGDKEWSRLFGGSGSEGGYCVKQTTNGGYIVVGHTSTFGVGGLDVYLLKTDGSGNKEWSKTFGGSNIDLGHSVQQTTDGGFIVVGYTWSFGAGGRDIYLVKTDEVGNEQWSKTFGGSNIDDGYSVQQTTGGGYIIVGGTESFGEGSYDVYLIKTNASGNEQWARRFGGSDYEGGRSIQQTTDGGYIIVGGTKSFGAGNYDVYLIKTDVNGDILTKLGVNKH